MPTALEIEENVGHPGEMWDRLRHRVLAESIGSFAEVQDDWLRLMWSYDGFRAHSVLPLHTERYFDRTEPFGRFGGFYRTKGNLFAKLIASLVGNRTGQELGSRARVQGFSQPHQIDVAWPRTREGVLHVAAETKVTGGPPYGDTPALSAYADFSNRRKELKFAATDLKLYRRQQGTAIRNWGVWRGDAPPKTFFLWAGRLKTEGKKVDDIALMVREARALVDTYLEAAGIFAWRVNQGKTGYEPVDVPFEARVTRLDEVLDVISSHIRADVERAGGRTPIVEVPGERAIDTEDLINDNDI